MGVTLMAALGPVETKTWTGSITWLAAGWLSGLLIEIIPWLKDNLTADQKQTLPIILAWVLASAAAYYAPHTHRPDLLTPPTLMPLMPTLPEPLPPPVQHEAPPHA
jgi:hypothetical protein